MAIEKSDGKRLLYAASTESHLARFHLDYISALRADGYAVETMSRGSGADHNISFEKRIFSPKNFLLIPKIRRIIKRGGYDAVILNTSLAAFYTRLACPRENRPRTVNIVHGYLFSERPSAKSLLLLSAERVLRQKTDVILTMNGEDTRLARKFRLAKGEIVEILGMGAAVKPPVNSPKDVKRELFGEDSCLLVFVGELSKRKNQKTLIKALPLIKKSVPKARLCLVGDGKERKSLERLASRLKISDSVAFVGERRNACDFIRAADLYVSPSLSEGMPFNVIEALGAGKTVLASNIKGHTDLIEDGRTGFLFKSGSARSLAKKLLEIFYERPQLSYKEIENKYLKYEKNAVFPKTLLTIKLAINH